MISLKPTAGNIILLAVLALIVVVGGPLLMIWSLNTLFPVLAIPYTFETWLAAFLVPSIFKTTVSVNK